VFFGKRFFSLTFDGVVEEIIGERVGEGEFAFGFAYPSRLKG
jgi:hypothetical protein